MKPDRGMDGLNLLLAGMGSAYGAFVPVYLTSQAWTQTHIGVVLTISTVVGILSAVPAGLIVDAFGPWRRTILNCGIVATGIVPLVFAVFPRGLPILVAMVIQAAAGSFFGPIIASTSLGLVGREGLGERIGRNGRYGSIGAGLGAAVMGLCGYLGSQRLAFFVAALLTVPALLAARAIGQERAPVAPEPADEAKPGFFAPFALLRDRRLLIYALCVALFQVASIAVLQLAAVDVTARLGSRGALVIAAFLIVPQVVVALISPWIGRVAETWGHRTVLLVSFATVPIRGALFATVRNPYVLVPVQVLEGAGGAAFGVMMPLVAADLTRGKNYTLCLSLLGLAGGAGTAVSSAVAGWTTDHFGRAAAFWALAAAGLVAVTLVALAMPETQEKPGERNGSR
ncbi:MAG: MFS transporter [Acetobacteraceae bacterium]|nr:MFS transporter [Acetobacteraceae bacterium]